MSKLTLAYSNLQTIVDNLNNEKEGLNDQLKTVEANGSKYLVQFNEASVANERIASKLEDVKKSKGVVDQELKEKIEDEFTVGKTVRDSFKYLGIKTEERKDGGFQQNQEEYISSLEQVEILAGHSKDELDEYGLSILRHGTGKLNWAAQGTRPELCYKVAELSTHFKSKNIGHLKLINKSIKAIQDKMIAVQYSKLEGELVIVGFCDAALNNMDDKVLSGGGYIVFLVDKELRSAPIVWSSTKIKRIVRSSLAAKALKAVECSDIIVYIKSPVKEVMKIEDTDVKMLVVTDSNNLKEALGSPHTVQGKRLRVDLAALKEDIMNGVVQIRHCSGSRQIADVLLKSGANPDLIRRVMSSGSLEGVVDNIV